MSSACSVYYFTPDPVFNEGAHCNWLTPYLANGYVCFVSSVPATPGDAASCKMLFEVHVSSTWKQHHRSLCADPLFSGAWCPSFSGEGSSLTKPFPYSIETHPEGLPKGIWNFSW